MGFAHGGLCFPTQSAAALHECGTDYPVFVQSGTTMYSTVCSGLAANQTSLALRPFTNATQGTLYNRPTFYPACDESEWLSYQPWSMSTADSVLISAAVIGVWLLAAGWRSIRRPVDEA